jgi:hypothetical protein
MAGLYPSPFPYQIWFEGDAVRARTAKGLYRRGHYQERRGLRPAPDCSDPETGIIVHKKTNFGWWHGSRYQRGVGSYQTDGPRLVHKP